METRINDRGNLEIRFGTSEDWIEYPSIESLTTTASTVEYQPYGTASITADPGYCWIDPVPLYTWTIHPIEEPPVEKIKLTEVKIEIDKIL